MRLIRDGENGGGGGGGGGMEVGWAGDYINIATRDTVTTRMIPALRWAAMRAILMFQQEVMDKVTRQCPQTRDSVHKPQPFWRERRAEAVSNRGPSAYQPNALPLGQTGSPGNNKNMVCFYHQKEGRRKMVCRKWTADEKPSVKLRGRLWPRPNCLIQFEWMNEWWKLIYSA